MLCKLRIAWVKVKNTLKIIHAADLHLDSPFQALGAEKAAVRRSEQRALLQRIAALVRERQADLLLLAGDLLDTGSVYAETARALCGVLGELDCPVLIAPGNHDYYCASSPWARLELPENVHVFNSGAVSCVSLTEMAVRVWGAAFTDAAAPPPLRGFSVPRQEGVLDIGLFHGEVGRPESPYAPISEQELLASSLHYVALGHIHAFGGLLRAGNTYYAWPGCTEGRGFDECGERGVLCVELDRSGACTAELVPLAQRKYEIVTLDVSAGALEERLPDSGGRDICRLVLHGESGGAPDIQHIAQIMSGRFFAFEIQNRTAVSRDIWEKAGEDTLRGLFLRRLRELYDGAQDEPERERITQAVRWGLAALDEGEAVNPL